MRRAGPADPAVVSRRPLRSWALFASVSTTIRLLVVTMLVFNVGFYLVLPFLAVHLTGLGLAAGWVGTVLGIRVLSQQGLFIVGGLVADRFGARRTILTGIGVRVVSFALLADVEQPLLLVLAVVAVGLGGALFTPAVEAVVAHESANGGVGENVTRTEVFALYSVCSQLGTLIGPVLGSLLVLGGFQTTCLVAAGVFATAFLVHSRCLPRELTTGADAGADGGADAGAGAGGLRQPGWGQVWRVPRLLLFAVASSGYLVVYHQLYLALPLELSRSTGSEAAAGWLLAGSALLVVLAQLRVTGWVQARWAPSVSLRRGFYAIAAGALLPALVVPAAGATPALLSLGGFVLLLTVAQMLILPASRDAVARIAGERALGAAYGLVSTIGGLGVLATSALVGATFDVHLPGWASAVPWLMLSLIAALSALGSTVVMRPLEPPRPDGRPSTEFPSRPPQESNHR